LEEIPVSEETTNPMSSGLWIGCKYL
jgi:hypothetical protein